MNIINRKMYKNIIKYTLLSGSSGSRLKILDIGYGNGYLIYELYKKSKADIAGIDISEDMKKAAIKKNYKGVITGRVLLKTGDCCNLGFKDNTFDIITSVNTIYFWKDTKKGMSEIYRVLKPGGIFYNAVYLKEFLQKFPYTYGIFNFFTKKDYIDIGKEAGFTKSGIKEIAVSKSYLIRYKK